MPEVNREDSEKFIDISNAKQKLLAIKNTEGFSPIIYDYCKYLASTGAFENGTNTRHFLMVFSLYVRQFEYDRNGLYSHEEASDLPNHIGKIAGAAFGEEFGVEMDRIFQAILHNMNTRNVQKEITENFEGRKN